MMLPKEYLYLFGAALPFMTIAVFLIEGAIRTSKNILIYRKRRSELASLPEAVRITIAGSKSRKVNNKLLYLWGNYAEQQIKKAGWKISPIILLLVSTFIAFAGMVGVYLITSDVTMTITTAVILVFLPFLILNWSVQKREQKIIDQLPIAIQLFTIEYQIVKNIKESLQRASQAVDNPLAKHINQCARELGSSRPYKEVFQRFSKNLNCEYGRLWAQTLFASTEDTTVVKLMPRLIMRLSGQRILHQKNINELSKERRLGILLNILILPGFIFPYSIYPEHTAQFYTTPFGKIVIVLVILSVLIGILLDQLLKRVDF